MKTLLTLAVLLATQFTFAFTPVSSSAVITTADFDTKSNLATRVFKAGMVRLNEKMNTVKVTLNFEPLSQEECIGAMCFSSNQQNWELPIVETSTDSCGVKTIIAYRNQIPVDGQELLIEITDNTKITCPVLFSGLFIPVAIDMSIAADFGWDGNIEVLNHYFIANAFEMDATIDLPIAL